MIEIGVSVALGSISMDLNYYRAVTDGEGQAIQMKGVADAVRMNRR